MLDLFNDEATGLERFVSMWRTDSDQNANAPDIQPPFEVLNVDVELFPPFLTGFIGQVVKGLTRQFIEDIVGNTFDRLAEVVVTNGANK